MDYKTKGVCSQQIHFEIEDNKIHNVSFVGGCNGNLQGISHLVEGMDVFSTGKSTLLYLSCIIYFFLALSCLFPSPSFAPLSSESSRYVLYWKSCGVSD